jgi:hypothetical protein
MRVILTCAVALGLVATGALAGEPAAPPTFTKKPTAVKAADGKVKIEFAVDRETDVTVSIEDANGKVVRRLVSGVLGKNPPAPLATGLAQSIEWDGRADWGKPATGGPFKVRVALGLGARYDKVVMGDPISIGGVSAMACGPDGTLYAVVGAGAGVPNWGAQRLVALNRDGTFQRTLVPPPANATKEQITALGGIPVEVGGRTVPLYLNLAERRNTGFSANDGAAATPDGKFLVLYPDARIGLVDTTGAAPPPPFFGPKLLPAVPQASFLTLQHRQYLAVSGDGQHAYFSGIAPKRSFSSEKTPPYPAVYRVKLPERSPAEPFFGDPAKAGSDDKSLGSIAHGMAADGKGNLLICDPANKRVVVVAEADGKFVGSFPAESPEFAGVARESGAVYLLKLAKGNSAEVVKLSGWKDPQQLAVIRLAIPRDYLQWRFAVDASAEPPVLWASNGWQLLRFEDLGDKFSEAKFIGGGDIGDGGFVNLTVDHYREDPEIYWRGGRPYWFARYNEKTGKRDDLKGMNFYSDAAGSCMEIGPDGNIYTPAWPQFLHKWDRNGKPVKWDVPYKLPPGVNPYGNIDGVKNQPPNAIYVEAEMVFMTHTLGIRGDGHIFKFNNSSPGGRGVRALYEYLPSGEKLPDPVIWKASDNVLGPRFDQQGNIYIAEQVRPLDQPTIPEFVGVVGQVSTKSRWDTGDPKGTITLMYGSIIKFSPKGGMVSWDGGRSVMGPNAFKGELKLDPALKTVQVGAVVDTSDNSQAFVTAKVTGAEWMHFGISDLPLFYCNCENTRFDVDPYGRTWYPDMGRYRVGVLDTNGNLITTFGGYGNAESCGPDSPVVDPRTGKVRARRDDDPKDLKSPFAEPEIAFSYLIGAGATDKYAYMGDSLNRRLLRARLVYAAEETATVP